MKKFLALALTLVMTMSLAACGGAETKAPAADQENNPSAPADTGSSGTKKVIKISFGLSAQSAEAVGAAKFEELIEAKYPEFDVQCYSDAQLGDDTVATQDVAMGNLECVITSASPLTGMCSDLQVFDLPFLFPDYEAADAVVDGEVGKAIADKLATSGLHVMAWYENGFREITNSKKEIHTPADLNGLKIRTMENPIHLACFTDLGAVPTPMAFSEVFTAMEQGAIDGQENPIATIYLNKFFEVNSYCTLTNHVYGPKLFLMNENLFNTLTAEQQEYFMEAAAESAALDRETNRKQCDDYIQNLRDAGMTVTELTAEEHQAFVDAAAGVYEEFAESINPDLIKQVQEICANS